MGIHLSPPCNISAIYEKATENSFRFLLVNIFHVYHNVLCNIYWRCCTKIPLAIYLKSLMKSSTIYFGVWPNFTCKNEQSRVTILHKSALYRRWFVIEWRTCYFYIIIMAKLYLHILLFLYSLNTFIFCSTYPWYIRYFLYDVINVRHVTRCSSIIDKHETVFNVYPAEYLFAALHS